MSHIEYALAELSSQINALEQKLTEKENALRGQQRDLFGNAVSQKSAINTDEINKRLDRAISHVEDLLKEE